MTGVAAEVVARLGLRHEQPVEAVATEAGAQAFEARGGAHGRLAARALGAAFLTVPLVGRTATFARALGFAVTLPFGVPLAAGSARAKRGGSPSCFRQRTRPRPMSTWIPPHCGHGSSNGRLNDTHSHLGQFEQLKNSLPFLECFSRMSPPSTGHSTPTFLANGLVSPHSWVEV